MEQEEEEGTIVHRVKVVFIPNHFSLLSKVDDDMIRLIVFLEGGGVTEYLESCPGCQKSIIFRRPIMDGVVVLLTARASGLRQDSKDLSVVLREWNMHSL